jgi:hypothetical protein
MFVCLFGAFCFFYSFFSPCFSSLIFLLIFLLLQTEVFFLALFYLACCLSISLSFLSLHISSLIE